MQASRGQTDRGAIIAAIIAALIVAIIGPLVTWYLTNQQARSEQEALHETVFALQTQVESKDNSIGETPTASVSTSSGPIDIQPTPEPAPTDALPPPPATDTPAPPTPIPTITAILDTMPGTILEIGQTWRQGRLELTMPTAIVRLGDDGVPSGAVFSLRLKNQRTREIVTRYGPENFSAVDNRGVTHVVMSDGRYADGRLPEIFPGTFTLTPGATKELPYTASAFRTYFDIGDPQITEVILTVTGISSIENARWRIPNLDH